MLSRRNAIRIFISVNIVSWLVLLAVNLVNLFDIGQESYLGVPTYVKGILFNIFLVFTFFYYRIKLEESNDTDFIELLSQVFVTGFFTVVISLFVQLVVLVAADQSAQVIEQLSVIFYHVNIGLVTVLLTKTLFVWKQMVLYKKSRKLQYAWNAFEFGLLTSLLLNFFPLQPFDPAFLVTFVLVSLGGLILSGNLKWVAYLNFNQKWQAILLILLTSAFLAYFGQLLFSYSTNRVVMQSLTHSAFILIIFSFVSIYCLFSVLVILFNIPTSSVFEKKMKEIINFQQLTHSLQAKRNFSQIYEVLLDSTSSAVLANAAWLEVFNESGQEVQTFLSKNISKEEADKVNELLPETSAIKTILVKPLLQNLKLGSALTDSAALPYKSILVVPLLAHDMQIGSLALVRNVSNGFDKESTEMVNTFVRLAGLAIENLHLVANALENERYQEELKIARQVQDRLIPSHLPGHPHFQMCAYSQGANTVGGDYYDVYDLDKERRAVIIGDVSGKGTSAAFNMAQLKGVFQSLVEMDLSPDLFLTFANSSLSRCLDKSSFITATYFILNAENQTVQYARAGHCPTLYFCSQTKEVRFLQDQGMGLGIIRNERYITHVQLNQFQYKPEDIIVLYTDGITEARNATGEEFGYERLSAFLSAHSLLTVQEIVASFIEELYAFCGTKHLNDDYTFLLIKFI